MRYAYDTDFVLLGPSLWVVECRYICRRKNRTVALVATGQSFRTLVKSNIAISYGSISDLGKEGRKDAMQFYYLLLSRITFWIIELGSS